MAKIKVVTDSSVQLTPEEIDKYDITVVPLTITIDGKTYSNANSMIISSKAAVYVIDGKKCDKEALTKIKPESIASMTVYKPGCKEAVELSGRKNIAVIKVVTK